MLNSLSQTIDVCDLKKKKKSLIRECVLLVCQLNWFSTALQHPGSKTQPRYKSAWYVALLGVGVVKKRALFSSVEIPEDRSTGMPPSLLPAPLYKGRNRCRPIEM